MIVNYKLLGDRIRNIRIKKELTQDEIAEKAELSNVYISHIECGTAKPSLETLMKICNALEITPDYVLLDSIYHSKEYIKDEIAELLKKCNDKNMKLVVKIIKSIIEEQ